LFYDNKNVFRFLFLLLLFYKEAGNAFVENKLELKTTTIESPGQKPGLLFLPPSPKGGRAND